MNKILIYSEQDINNRVKKLGSEISNYYKSCDLKTPLVVLGILTGGVVFTADLIRNLDLCIELDFVKLSSYENKSISSAKIVMTKDFEIEVRDRHVLVVEDIADFGYTLTWFKKYIKSRKPASVKTAVLINKKERRETELIIDYIGFDVTEGFLVGYGLDYAGQYRNLPAVYHLELSNKA